MAESTTNSTGEALTNRVENAEHQESNAYNQYMNSVETAFQTLKDGQTKMRQAKETMEDATAENQAAQMTNQGQVLTVSDALKLVDEEQQAKQQYQKQASEYMSSAAEVVGKAFSGGMAILTDSAGEAADNLKDGLVDNFKSGKKGLLLTGGAAAVGLSLLPGGMLHDLGQKVVADHLQLKDQNEVDSDVEVKFIEGQDTPENVAKSVSEDTGHDPNDYDKDATGKETDTEKKITEDENHVIEASEDALDATESDFDMMSKISNSFNTITKDVMHGAASIVADKSPVAGNLIENIAEKATTAVTGVTTGVPSKLDLLKDFQKTLEKSQAEREVQEKDSQDTPSYGSRH